MKTLFKDFIKCGLTGWCLEILFTSFGAFRRRDMRLQGVTSLWMFPIYGLAVIIKPFAHMLHHKSIVHRGLVYMTGIFIAEYLAGGFLKKRRLCPWNYHFSSWQFKDVIRLDYAPLWFLVGLLYERILMHHNPSVLKKHPS